MVPFTASSHPLMALKNQAKSQACLGSAPRRKVATNSSAVKGVRSDHVTDLSRWNVQVSPSLEASQLLAAAGTRLKFLSNRTSGVDSTLLQLFPSTFCGRLYTLTKKSSVVAGWVRPVSTCCSGGAASAGSGLSPAVEVGPLTPAPLQLISTITTPASNLDTAILIPPSTLPHSHPR